MNKFSLKSTWCHPQPISHAVHNAALSEALRNRISCPAFWLLLGGQSMGLSMSQHCTTSYTNHLFTSNPKFQWSPCFCNVRQNISQPHILTSSECPLQSYLGRCVSMIYDIKLSKTYCIDHTCMLVIFCIFIVLNLGLFRIISYILLLSMVRYRRIRTVRWSDTSW